MHEIIDDGDLFTYPMDITDAVCVTTNGCINSKALQSWEKELLFLPRNYFPILKSN